MSPAWDEVWVTVAEDDKACMQALIFVKSLKRIRTNRKTIVLAGPTISSEIRRRLEKEFDCLLFISHNLLSIKGLTLRNCAVLNCLSLSFVKKCAFVDRAVLMLRNCDNLFEMDMVNSVAQVVDGSEGSVVVLSSSMDVYCSILQTLKQTQSDKDFQSQQDPNLFFENWLQSLSPIQLQKGKFVISVDLENDSSATGNIDSFEPSLVHFIEKNPFELITREGRVLMPFKAGTFEKEILELWMSLYRDINTDRVGGKAEISGHPPVNEPIAIIGMSGRFPSANNVEEFWDLLISGEDGQKPIPEYRWTPKQSCVIEDDEKKMNAGFLKCPIDQFDGSFFQMSPMELIYTDPQQRFLLEVSWEALEDANIDPLTLKGSPTGIFTGIWTNDYKDLMTESGFRGTEFYRSYMGNSFGATGGRLSHFLEVTGPNISTESGCSTSMVAVGLACKSLRNGESSLALACGVNLLLRPYFFEDLKVVNSPDGKCKPFDSKADGYGRAEGCGVLVLKRLSDAVRDGDTIRALIRGYGQTQEGTSLSMGTPTSESETLAMKLALSEAGVEACEVSYVEAHGTGTPVGDPLEMKSIQAVYSKNRLQPLIVGSVKSNVGHTESCSGIVGIIKTVLSLEKEIIPPNINFETLNPKINLSAIPAEIPLVPKLWKKTEDNPRIAGVSSFGITGCDTHLIIEESPLIHKIQKYSKYSESARVLTLSAKTEDALNDLMSSYENHLKLNPTDLSDMTFTANTGRAHLEFRAAVVGESCEEILTKLENRSLTTNDCKSGKPKLCLLFTGQGSQYAGMGKKLYRVCPVFRENFDICDKLLKDLYNLSIGQVIWDENASVKINETMYSQTSIFVTEYCLMKVWESWGLKPDAVLGHSVGEFAAATAAGILTLADALKLVTVRCRLIDRLPLGKMLVIKASKEVTEALRNEVNQSDFWVDIAAVNSPTQTVVAGFEEFILIFEKLCKAKRIKTHLLNASHAFHSRVMEPLLPEYKNIASSVSHSKPTCEYISGLDGKTMDELNGNYWLRLTRNGMEFIDACKEVGKKGPYVFLEVGPSPVIVSLVAENLATLTAASYHFSMKEKQNEWTTMVRALGNLYTQGFDVNWKEFHRYYCAKKVSLPFYPFQRSLHWFPTSNKRISSLNGRQLHPLLGFELPNASSQKVYHNHLDLSHKATFLKDHVIGKHIVFPGAGYIEMCLAAGEAVILPDSKKRVLPSMPLILENLSFKAPLAIRADNGCEMQTTVGNIDSVDGIERKRIRIYKLQEEDDVNRWTLHAKAIVRFESKGSEAHEDLKLEEIKQKFKDELKPRVYYQRSDSTGLKFGDTFRSLKKIWTSGSELLAQAVVPQDFNEFLVHPILIDCMLQTIIFQTEGKESLILPIGIGEFKFYKKPTSFVNYIHTRANVISVLYDEGGDILAVMQGTESMSTNLENVTRLLETQGLKSPKVFENVLKRLEAKSSTHIQSRTNPSRVDAFWIVLSDGGALLEDITTEIKTRGRNVIHIRCGSSWQKVSNSEALVRPDVKEDMEAAISSIQADHLHQKLEGVVYLWGLDHGRGPSDIALGFLHLVQTALKSSGNELPGVFVVTQGALYIEDQEPVNPCGGTLWGLTRTFRSEYPSVCCRCIDLDPTESHSSRNKYVLTELWSTDEEFEVAYRNGARFVPRLIPVQLSKSQLSIPVGGRFSLVLAPTNSIEDLTFRSVLEKPIVGNEIEIRVKALGLNFKEVLNILKPTSEFENTDSVGMDFSGVVAAIGPNVTLRKVGDLVMGCGVENGPLPSHIRTAEDNVVCLPSDMTFAEGATLSTAFTTVHVALITEGNLKRGETILIHTASGGVGMVAIQMAKYLGAEVIATAGSKRKRAFVRSLGVQHVFSSRDTSFGEQIKELTGGKGVQMVLNSLTGPGFKESSLGVCGLNARFLEMSKLNIWSAEEVASFRPDVKYSLIDLHAVSKNIDSAKKLHQHLGEFLSKKYLQPLPTAQFDASKIREALTYLQKARHIGKVVVMMPESEGTNGRLQPKQNMFNDRSTYLITGGLGGVGLEVAKWMANLGAKYLVLFGRSKPNAQAQIVIDQLKGLGKQVEVMEGDVGDINHCTSLLKSMKDPALELPPLRGVMHAAGCLADKLLVNQTPQSFEVSFNAKVQGGLNLHTLTRAYNLEHFIMFSSISSVFGAVGQGNYAAANSYLDSLAHYRHYLGLPAATVNWGQWGGVGMAADIEIPGLTPFKPAQGLNSLELAMKARRLQTTIVLGNPSVWKLVYPWTKKYLEELRATTEIGHTRKATKDILNSTKFWKDLEAADEVPLKRIIVQKIVSSILSSLLNTKEDTELRTNQNLEELGVDSLMWSDLKNMLQRLLGDKVSLSLSEIRDCNTIILLANRLLELIYDNHQVKDSTGARKQLIQEDCILPSHIKADGIYMKPSEIRVVLVTGVTGNLGPYILESLSKTTQLSKIYCIVRGKKTEAPTDRLINNLKAKDLYNTDSMHKVEVIEGNISEVNLGIPQDLYDLLATEVDAIINIAVKSNYLEEYKKSEGNLGDTRTVNIVGIHRVLEFASAKKTKWVYQASSLLATRMGGEDGIVPETWPRPGEFDDCPNFAYATSKYISDRIVAQAVEVGIPCKVFRFPMLAGESKRGAQSIADNHFFTKYLYYFKSGLVPDMIIPLQIMPVDVAARISLQVFFDDRAPTGVYNVTNPHNNSETDLCLLAKDLGIPLRVVDYPQFVNRIVADGKSSLLYTMTEFYSDDERYWKYMNNMKLLKQYAENPSNFYTSHKIMKLIPNLKEIVEPPFTILRRDMKYARAIGMFHKDID